MRIATRLIPIFFIAVLAITLTGSPRASAADSQDSVVEQVLQRGVLRVGMSTFVPWAMKDKTGELIGFEIDVARRLAEDMGVKVEFVPTKWAGIIPALLTGKFDVIIGGMGILPSRNLKVNFTNPYDYTGMSLVASKKMAAGMTGIEAFNKPGVVIAARLGSTAVTATKKYLPKAEIRMFDDEAQAYQEVYQRPGACRGRFSPHAGLPGHQVPGQAFSAYRRHLYPGTHRLRRKEGRCGHAELFQQLDRLRGGRRLAERPQILLV